MPYTNCGCNRFVRDRDGTCHVHGKSPCYTDSPIIEVHYKSTENVAGMLLEIRNRLLSDANSISDIVNILQERERLHKLYGKEEP